MKQAALEAKVEKLAQIIVDANARKEEKTVGDTRKAEAKAANEVLQARTQYEVRAVELPSERLGDEGDE